MPVIPVIPYQLCTVAAKRGLILGLISLSLAFGEYPSLFLIPSFPELNHPPLLRHRGFHARHHTNATYQTLPPWDAHPDHPRLDQQGRMDLLRGHIFVSFHNRYDVRCGEGKVLCALARG